MRENFIRERNVSKQSMIQIRHILKKSFGENPNIINEIEPSSKEYLEAYDDFNQKIKDFLNHFQSGFADKRSLLRHYFKWSWANNIPCTPITIRKMNEYCVFLKEKENRGKNRIKRTITALNELRQALYKKEDMKRNEGKTHE